MAEDIYVALYFYINAIFLQYFRNINDIPMTILLIIAIYLNEKLFLFIFNDDF